MEPIEENEKEPYILISPDSNEKEEMDYNEPSPDVVIEPEASNIVTEEKPEPLYEREKSSDSRFLKKLTRDNTFDMLGRRSERNTTFGIVTGCGNTEFEDARIKLNQDTMMVLRLLEKFREFDKREYNSFVSLKVHNTKIDKVFNEFFLASQINA